jgi:adenosylhomocysteine nucleosidase
MKARIAIVAALPREIAPLVRDWPIHSRSRSEGWTIAEKDRAIAVCAGMGRERAARALELAEARGPLFSIFSVGYAGALRSGFSRNSVYWPSVVIDAKTGEQYACDKGSETLVTMDHVVRQDEKGQLADRWNADLVDMEAAAIARFAQMRGLPFRAVRVVSDEFGDVLPDLDRFIDAQGRFRQLAFAINLALHPWMVPAAVRLGRDSAQASRNLAEALRETLENAE